MTQYAEDSRLVFDLGMNNGDDTAYYLGRGFNVIALDANPTLCETARRRFTAAVDEGRLAIVHAAIAAQTGEIIFHVNLDNDHWSSLDIGWAGRDASRCQDIRVPCVTLPSLFGEFGVPHYLKIDVEGADQTVLDQLKGTTLLPQSSTLTYCGSRVVPLS